MKLYKQFMKTYNFDTLFNVVSNILRLYCKKNLNHIEYFTEGRINLLFKLYLNDNKVAVLRICMVNDSIFGQDVKNAMYFETILKCAVPQHVVEIYCNDMSCSIIPYPYIIIEECVGHVLSMNDPINVFEKVGVALSEIHSIKLDFWGKKYPSDNSCSVAEYYDSFYLSTLEHIKNYCPNLYFDVKHMYKMYFEKKLLINRKCVLLHHDIHFNNIIVSNDNTIKIIDWDSARGGMPELDFIKIKYLNFKNQSNNKLEALIKGYKKNMDIIIDNNYFLYELFWLAKMIIFEKYNKITDSYYPNLEFYEREYENCLKKMLS